MKNKILMMLFAALVFTTSAVAQTVYTSNPLGIKTSFFGIASTVPTLTAVQKQSESGDLDTYIGITVTSTKKYFDFTSKELTLDFADGQTATLTVADEPRKWVSGDLSQTLYCTAADYPLTEDVLKLLTSQPVVKIVLDDKNKYKTKGNIGASIRALFIDVVDGKVSESVRKLTNKMNNTASLIKVLCNGNRFNDEMGEKTLVMLDQQLGRDMKASEWDSSITFTDKKELINSYNAMLKEFNRGEFKKERGIPASASDSKVNFDANRLGTIYSEIMSSLYF